MENGERVFIEGQTVSRSRSILRRNNDPSIHISLRTPKELVPKIEELINICIDQSVFSMDLGYRPEAADNPEFIDYQKTLNQTISKIIVGDYHINACMIKCDNEAQKKINRLKNKTIST